MIVDTSFLIDVLRGRPSVAEWERELAESTPAVVTSISVMELWEGVQLADAGDAERQRVRELLAGLTQAAFESESAMVAGEVSAALPDAGTPIDIEAVMIGAIALERDEPVVTGSPDDFERIDGLAVESY